MILEKMSGKRADDRPVETLAGWDLMVLQNLRGDSHCKVSGNSNYPKMFRKQNFTR